jgi:hypothetical protein
VYNQFQDIVSQYKNDECQINVVFSDEAIKYLKDLPERSEKELTGEFKIKETRNNAGKVLYVLSVDKNSVKEGKHEDVDVEPHRFNFHSHPRAAYIKYGVKKAWPSLEDYLGVQHLGSNTIFHCVSTIEGLYIISFSAHWCNKIGEIDPHFIREHYDISHLNKETPSEYVNRINGIKCGESPIFHVQFFNWKNADRQFRVYYAKTGSGCISSEPTKRRYESLFS